MAMVGLSLSKPPQLIARTRLSFSYTCLCSPRIFQYKPRDGNDSITNITSVSGLGLEINNRHFSLRTNDDDNKQTQMSFEENSKDKEAALLLKYKPKEFQVKTSYGHIACLEWGKPQASHKILCVHGWLDNVGSFTRLIPHILDIGDNAENMHIIGMDMPGVGKSSHLPIGASYTSYTTIIEMRRLLKIKDWQRITLLSHSLGSHYSFLYSCIYPKQVETFISIDLTQPLANQAHNWNVTIANSIEEHFKSEFGEQDKATNSFQVPVYSQQDAIKRLMDAHSNSLTLESAHELLKRGATKESWGYTFNRDIRWRHLSVEFRPTDELMLQYLDGPFRPNLFIIRASQSPYQRPEKTKRQYYELYTRNCPVFQEVLLEGTHHLHMNTPDIVAQAINKFLEELKRLGSVNKSNL